MKSIFRSINNYLSLVKFSHTVFAMPFALLGFFTAIKTDEGEFSWRLLLLVILCMVFARNAAMGFNRYADQRTDRMNPRTAGREIPAGIISSRAALLFVIINSVLFIAATGFINILTLALSPVALAVILGYSLTKRFTSLSHLFLGLALSLAPTGAYISVTGNFDIIPIMYSFVVLFWVAGFDIIYSLQDSEFDHRNQLLSIPVKLGPVMSLILSALFHLASVALVVISGLISGSGIFFWTGTAIFALILTWEHIIVKPGDNSSILKAFGTMNSYAGLLFCALAITDIFV